MRVVELPARVAELLVRLYRIFPGRFMPPMCRYRPSCSEYMLRSLRLHGLLKGGYLGCRRILRCHPFGRGGFDPVPGDEERARRAYDEELERIAQGIASKQDRS